LTKQPDGPITRGVPTAFRFHCRDQDTSDKDHSEWMFISLNGRLGQCGSVIAVTIFNDDPRSSIVATLPDTPWNHAASLTIPSVSPASTPPPPPPGPRSMGLTLSASPSGFIPANGVSGVTVSQVEWIATPSWGGAGPAQHLTGTDTGSGFRVAATFTVPASIAVPIVQVRRSAKFTDSTGSQVIHMAVR
jgi:hypothetical protein